MRKKTRLLYVLIGLSLLTLCAIVFDFDIVSWYFVINDILDNNSILMLFSGVFLSALATLSLVLIFRPNIEIASVNQHEEPQCQKNKGELEKSDNNNKYRIKINIKNKMSYFGVNNVQIEAAFFNNKNQTFHLDFDRASFLIIRSKDERTFQAMNLNEFAIRVSCYSSLDKMIECINSGENKRSYTFRVRVHAEHSFTGFGKSFEKVFLYKNGEFIDRDSFFYP